MAKLAPPVLPIGTRYQQVAASQSTIALGPNGGAKGDYIAGLIIVPATTSPGAVTLLDNATSITLFTGGATSVADLKTIQMDLDMHSVSGPWKITTGANVSVIATGEFS